MILVKKKKNVEIDLYILKIQSKNIDQKWLFNEKGIQNATSTVCAW